MLLSYLLDIAKVELICPLFDGIMEVATLYPETKKGKTAPRPVITISSMNKTQKRLFEIFDLERYRS